MPDQLHVQQLLEEILEQGRTPEEVCADDPELLREVRARWIQVRCLENQLDDLFPGLDTPRSDPRASEATAATAVPQIEGYVVESVLGWGGMGVVFKARQLKPNRFIALKMLLAGAHAGPLELARFRREAEAVAAAAAPEHRSDPRGRGPRRPTVLHDGVRRGGQPGSAPGRRASGPAPSRRVGGRARGRRPFRAHEWHHSPRSEAGEHSAERPAERPRRSALVGRAEDRGLRAGSIRQRRTRTDTQWYAARDAELHGARAGSGQGDRHRAGGGRLRAGCHPVRSAHRSPTVRGIDGGGNGAPGHLRGAGATVAVQHARAARRGNNLPQVPAQEPEPALRHRRRPGRRPRPFPPRRGDRRATGRPAAAPGPAGPAPAGTFGRACGRRAAGGRPGRQRTPADVRADHDRTSRGRGAGRRGAGRGGGPAGHGPVAEEVFLARGARRAGAGEGPTG